MTVEPWARLIATRARNQHIHRPARIDVDALVSWMGAVQAQDYAGAAWGLGQRIDGCTLASIDRAFDAGAIIRTHVMRPTWHFVAPADLVWLQRLTAPRVHAFNRLYYRREGLDEALLVRSASRIERLLRDGQYLTRTEIAGGLARAGIHASGLRLALLMMYAELEAVVCSGPRRGKQFTYALVGERMSRAPTRTRDEALVELTRRYVTSHGPVTARDFSWWSGLPVADATRGLADAGSSLIQERAGPRTYWLAPARAARVAPAAWARLLPNYDELLIAYRDRDSSSIARPSPTARGLPRDRFQHHLMISGRIAGSWRARSVQHVTRVEFETYRALAPSEARALTGAIERYSRFVG